MTDPAQPDPGRVEGFFRRNKETTTFGIAVIIGIVWLLGKAESRTGLAYLLQIVALVSLFVVLPTVAAILFRRNQKPASDLSPTRAIAPDPMPSVPPILRFLSYTEDTFDRVKWRWRWRQGVDFMHPSFIEDLAPFCPTCDLRIVPQNLPAPSTLSRIRCEKGCFSLIVSVGCQTFKDDVRLQIEREARRIAET
jgi:hypothetical protein